MGIGAIIEIVQTWIAAKASERTAMGAELVAEYVERSGRYCVCRREAFADETGFWDWVERQRGRTVVVALDSGGRQMTSTGFAEKLGRWRDEGVRRLVLGIGPADGWSAESKARADASLSFGLMTMPHELARVVLAEQVYRALTILAGHPYHCGH